MNNAELKSLLRKLDACSDAIDYVGSKSPSEAWAKCQRADWMLWLCGKMTGHPTWPSRKEVAIAACACAETALQFVPKNEKRPAIAIETARKWAHGEATTQEARNADNDAQAAVYADNDAANSAAIAAAYVAAYAAADVIYPTYTVATAAVISAANAAIISGAYIDAYVAAAAMYPAYAVIAAADAAAYAVTDPSDNSKYNEVCDRALAQMADIVRNMLDMTKVK